MAIKKKIQPQTTTNRIIGSVILVKFETGKIHQMAVEHNILMGFIAAISSQNGSLNIIENPIEGITF